ncbi:TetR family transcriptional regulator [Mycetocola saprophilus]|uniref:TetR family transcriptional regulator n=1 Tax=Mycetocola saprophilus TaxID=76636 RepID=UPI003BF0D57A
MTVQRARSSDAKARRAEDLLDAAESLALELGGVRHVTLAPVTERAGLHRTAVRRYFESKEELLLELAERGWKQWRESIDLALEGRAGLDARAVADVLTDTLTALPVFCDCLTHVSLSLEGDVSIERARRFKHNAFIQHDALVVALTEASVLSVEVVTALVPAASALAASMWQVSHPSPSLAELYVQEPQWGHIAYDFEPRLRVLVEAMAIGLSETLPRRAE